MIFFTQFRPRSGLVFCWASGSKLFENDGIPERNFIKETFEKKSVERKKMYKVTCMHKELVNSCLRGSYAGLRSLLIFFKINFLENSFWNIIRVSNSLDPDPARLYAKVISR